MDLYLICRLGAWANMAEIEAATAKLPKATRGASANATA